MGGREVTWITHAWYSALFHHENIKRDQDDTSHILRLDMQMTLKAYRTHPMEQGASTWQHNEQAHFRHANMRVRARASQFHGIDALWSKADTTRVLSSSGVNNLRFFGCLIIRKSALQAGE